MFKPKSRRYTPILYSIALLIILFFMPLMLIGGIYDYFRTRDQLLRASEKQRANIEDSIIHALTFTKSGHKIIEKYINEEIDHVFEDFEKLYKDKRGNISDNDLMKLREKFLSEYELCVVDDMGKILKNTTSAEELKKENIGIVISKIISEELPSRYHRAFNIDSELGFIRKCSFLMIEGNRFLVVLHKTDDFNSMLSELNADKVGRHLITSNPILEEIGIYNEEGICVYGRNSKADKSTLLTIKELLKSQSPQAYRIKEISDKEYIKYIAIPFVEESHRGGRVITLKYNLKPIYEEISRSTRFFIFMGIGTVLTVVAVAFFISAFISRPITRIIKEVRKVSEGNINHDIDLDTDNELNHLVDSINIMLSTMRQNIEQLKMLVSENEKLNNNLEQEVKERTEELESLNKNLEERISDELKKRLKQEQLLIQQSKMASMGEMIGMIAHQWRQPLSSISTLAATMLMHIELENVDETEFSSMLEAINKQAQFLSGTINDFRNFYRPNKEAEKIRIESILEETFKIIGKSLEYKGIVIEKEIDSMDEIFTHKNEMMQVLLNLLKNAQDVLVERKISEPTISIVAKEDSTSQTIIITDNAGGIPNEYMEKIFEPYFTTKDSQTGTGLGLYMSKMIVEKHCGGSLYAENTNKGARFTVSIPKS